MPARGRTGSGARRARRRLTDIGRLVENAARIRRELPRLRTTDGRERRYRALKKYASRPHLARDLSEIRHAVELLSGASSLGREASDPGLFRVSADFNKVQVDLSDVLGSPGLPAAGELAERASGAFKGAFRQAARVPQPFLFGEARERLAGDPEAQVNAFVGRLDRALPDHELHPKDLKLLVARRSATGSHLVVQQTVRDQEVVGARFQLHVDPTGRPYGLTGRPVGDLRAREPGDAPRRTRAEVSEALRSTFGLKADVRVRTRPVVFPLSGGCVWAYEARFVAFEPAVADVRAYLRADDLGLLVSFNVASAALHGEASVYPVNPRRTGERAVVRLDHLGPTPTDSLSGPVVVVRPRDGRAVRDKWRDFRLEPGARGFDEPNAYYHLCNAVRYFENLFDRRLLQAAPFAPVRAVVRDTRSPANAYYMPSSGELLFGDFGARPSARSADIIYHELAHAVSDAVCRVGRGVPDSQARGMSEGYSDYFQASALGDPRIGDYIADNLAGHRNLSRKGLKFPDGFTGEEHETGEVWGGVLWSIHEAVGAGVADKIVAESLQFLNPTASFEEGLAALLLADARVFPNAAGGGRHAGVIREEFARRR